MKKILAILLTFVCVFSFFVNVFAEEEESANIVDPINSGFEDAETVEDTAWFKLLDAFGNSKKTYYTDMEIKSGGAHSGTKYLSTKGSKSWHSPAINLHPFFVEAGSGEYMISFYFRCKEKNIKTFTVRALQADYDADPNSETFPGLQSRGESNYFSTITGTVTEMGDWDMFLSSPFEVSDTSLAEPRNWWFCFASMPDGYTVDIDDFCIIPADDYEDPNELDPTEITYLSQEIKNSVIPAQKPDSKIDEMVSQITPDVGTDKGTPAVNETDITLYVCIAIGVAALVIIVPVVIVRSKKRK